MKALVGLLPVPGPAYTCDCLACLSALHSSLPMNAYTSQCTASAAVALLCCCCPPCRCCPCMHAQVVCSFIVILMTTSSLLGPADRCYLSSKPSQLGACYFAVTAGAVSIGTAVLAGCLTVRNMSFTYNGQLLSGAPCSTATVQPVVQQWVHVWL